MRPPLEELFESSLELIPSENALRPLPPARGMILFADSDNVPIQLLTASNIRRTAQARLADPKTEEPLRKADLRPIASCAFFTPVSCDFHATWLYNRLTRLLFPQKADLLIALPPAHCVRLDPEEQWAAFSPSDHPGSDSSAVYYGPFPSRKAAVFFARCFNDLFGLCRNRPLALSGRGEQCSYYQMGLCPGPCLSPGDKEPYRRTVGRALQDASGPIRKIQENLTSQMHDLSAKMQFEQAQLVKNNLDQVAKLQTAPYRWTRRLDTLKILHIDRGINAYTAEDLRRKSPRFCAYLISAERIDKLPNFSLSSIQNLTDFLSDRPRTNRLFCETMAENVALLSLFLYKTNPPGLWFDLQKTPRLDKTYLLKAIQNRFTSSASSG